MPGDEKKTATTTRTEVKTRRVQSLEPKSGKELSSLEEAVVRMHHGVSVKADAKLPTNGVNDDLMRKLLEMEVRAFEKSGRIDELDDVPDDARPANAATKKIVAELAKKS